MKNIIPIMLIILAVAAMFIFGYSGKKHIKHELIFTQISVDESINTQFPERSRIVSIDPADPEYSFEILSSAFQSARSPQTSFDGKRLLFSGKLKESDSWQIWEMVLANHKILQITKSDKDCTDPAYLPDGRILFSAKVVDTTSPEFLALYTIDRDGNTERISFQPHADLLSMVMLDGRILTSSRQLFPDVQNPKLLALRPDGTKTSLYYQSPENYFPVSRPYETSDRHLLLVESQIDQTAGDLISISTNRPLHSRKVLFLAKKGIGFHSIYSSTNDEMIASFREIPSSTFGIYYFDKTKNELGKKLYSDENWNSLEPQYLGERVIPRILPTTVDPTVKTGKMICMNSGLTDLKTEMNVKPSTIQVFGIDRMIGSVNVENDGSFYIELAPDTPVRFQALDEDGNEILDPSSWLWVRPNESRGCVGCHEDRELSPDNKVPLAIINEPVLLIPKSENAE